MAAKKPKSGGASRVPPGSTPLPATSEGLPEMTQPKTQEVQVASPHEASPQAPTHRLAFPIVGIGASAGGIDALKALFGAMPADSGMAFVVIQHLDPKHDSRMAEILTRFTTMTVVQAVDGMPVRPNTVFTNPPGRALCIRGGRLELSMPAERRHVEGAIDQFMISLANDQCEKAIGIILSGSSAVDGPRGIRAVRAAGGMCMAQDPQTAEFPAMPQGAVDTGLVDHVLPVGQMPAALIAYAQHLQTRTTQGDEPAAESASDDLESILRLLRTRAKSDYRYYKRGTILRRIQRRMGLRQIASTADYLEVLQQNPTELTQLSKDMLIGVSSFFRDPEVFEALRSEVIVPLVAAKDPDSPVRAWVAGCATGEEAYTVAMLLLEATAAGKGGHVQVFASDVDTDALDVARAGLYANGIADEVSPDRLKRFFRKQNQAWQVDKQLREAVLFSRQNLLSDPPFSKLDLVSCRNVLIYLEPAAQKKILAMFSFALNTGGGLLLGKSEGVTGMEDLFQPVARQQSIYRLTRTNRRAALEIPPQIGGVPVASVERSPLAAAGLAQANQEAILRHFNASLLLVDPKGQIRYFHGRTEKYLGHPKGVASLNILDMTAGTLSAKLRRAIEQAMQQDEPVVIPHVSVPREEAPPANLTVIRLPVQTEGGNLLAIVFEDAREPKQAAAAAPLSAEGESLISQLEAEVKAVRTELRARAEEYDAANEELKAGNEEVMSMNEELQSANEEMEASKEEMQSINEELTTVNSQLAENVTELTETNDDLANLLGSTHIATVFLDKQMRIRRFTASATELLNLLPGDVGRPINHITQNFAGEQLIDDAEKVLKSLSVAEKEVHARDGSWHTVRILPYRTLDDRIDGVVITFSDVTRLKRVEAALQYDKTYGESIVETVQDPLIVLDGQLRITSVNSAFYRMFQVKPEDVVGQLIYSLGDQQWDIARLRELLERIIPNQATFRDFRVEHDFPGIGRRTLLLNGRRVHATGEIPECILLAMEDVTERERDRELLRALTVDLEQRVLERTAQLQALAIQLSQTEQRERHRLAKVLHDGLQQLLVGAKFHLQILRNQAPGDDVLQTVQQLNELLDQSLETSRSLTVEMSPPILYQGTMGQVLGWLALWMHDKHGLSVHLEIDEKANPKREEIRVLVFETVRELLLNIVKHAKVTSATIRMTLTDSEHVQVIVADEGVGFDAVHVQPRNDSGFGLLSIRQRLAALASKIDIDSAPGKGTRVTLVVPTDLATGNAATVSPLTGA
jgi:two-component system, chemotaxis family, CheB/CheR fusion protein